MTPLSSRISARLALATTFSAFALVPALADGMDKAAGGMKDAMPAAQEAREFKFSWNLGVTNNYIFRGFSQTKLRPAIQGGIDITYGTFYAGTWMSNVDFSPSTDAFGRPFNAPVEIDLYTGFKPVLKTAHGDINFDFGVIAYTYPNQSGNANSMTFVEGKAAMSREIWKDGTLASTLFYSPQYQLGAGRVFTSETSFTQNLPAHGKWVPSLSATYAYQWGSNNAQYLSIDGNGEKSYAYWNAGATFTYDTKTSLDFRYWGTDLHNDNALGGGVNGFCNGRSQQCGNHFSATLKYTY